MNALRDLDRYGWIVNDQYQMKVNQSGREAAALGLRSGWRSLFERYLTPAQESLLKAIVDRSEQRDAEYCWLEYVVGQEIEDDLDLGNQPVWKVGAELVEAEFLDAGKVTAGSYRVFPTYGGVVRATERLNNELQELVLSLLPDWETANVDFERQLVLRSKDQKLELARDVIALANTQVTAPRFLVIGFDAKTRQFAPGLDPKVTQDVIEDVLNDLVRPAVEVRLQSGDWTDGRDGLAVLEVIRDRSALPYSVRRDARGERNVLRVGDVFVRRATHVSGADAEERAALQAEGDRARSGSLRSIDS
jgi:hypothetical protein